MQYAPNRCLSIGSRRRPVAPWPSHYPAGSTRRQRMASAGSLASLTGPGRSLRCSLHLPTSLRNSAISVAACSNGTRY
eukprot:2024255-Pyramimonas_sp.AAC.1